MKTVKELTPEQVREIRRIDVANPNVTHRTIGTMYGLTPSQVSSIIRRRSRKDVS